MWSEKQTRQEEKKKSEPNETEGERKELKEEPG